MGDRGTWDQVVSELTQEWLDAFNLDKIEGKEFRDSVFWRLALHSLPEGVDPNHPEVLKAIEEIRESVNKNTIVCCSCGGRFRAEQATPICPKTGLAVVKPIPGAGNEPHCANCPVICVDCRSKAQQAACF